MAPLRILACLFAVCFSAWAQLAPTSDYEGKTIAEIRFEPVRQPLTQPDIERALQLKPGSKATLNGVRDAIKRLYATGRYSAIEVDSEPAANGVTLVFRTADQWFVGPVEVRGKVSAPPNRGQLANASRLELGQPYEDQDLDGAVKGVLDLMNRNGLYTAKVQPRVERDPEYQHVAITFDVDSGKRARLMLPVVIGDTRIPPEELAKSAKYKRWWFLRWRYATAQNTAEGLAEMRNKYASEDRLTASVSLQKMDYLEEKTRVQPTIFANGGPKVDIKAEGADVSKSDLRKYVPVLVEGQANRDLLVRGVANLRDYFQNKGYFNVQVDFDTREINPDHEEITYRIDLGPRQKLVQVDVQGNHYFSTDAIRERMFLREAGLLHLRHGRYSNGFAEKDQESIQALYRANGFQDAKVTMTLIPDYRGQQGNVAVAVRIDEGAQYLVGDIEVEGITRPDRDQVISQLASITGQPYSQTNVAMDRQFILNHYYASGYPDAAFDWRMDEGPGPRQVTLRYIVREGEPRYIRDVLLLGLHETNMRLISPNVTLKSGDPLSWTEMGNMQRRLYELGVFDRVDMAVQNPNGETQNKYVLYQFSEGHRYNLSLGGGAEIARIGGAATNLSSPAGATGFSPRGSLQLSRFNMFGLGHTMSLQTRYSTLSRRFLLNYYAPRYRNVDGRNISLTALYENTRDVLTFTAKRLEGSAQISQRFSKSTTAFWRYSWRDVRVDTSTLKINPLLIPTVSQPARIGMLSSNVVRDRRDDPADAHRGTHLSGDLGLANHWLGGGRNFMRFLGRGSIYRPIHGPDYILATNTQFGWIRPFRTGTTDPFNYVPLPERFFGGGSASNRGFPDNQAGPRDELTGFPLGGNALFFHSTEFRFPMIGSNIEGVFFHDMGNIYTSFNKISFRVSQKDLKDFDYMVHAVGFGIRYRTPVGPVRVDLAYSINPPRFNGLNGTYQDLLFGTATPAEKSVRKFQFFISIGQAF